MVQFLLDAGAQPNARRENDGGQTALHACESAMMVPLLLEKGADLEAVDDNGWTPLHSFCWLARRMEVIDALVNMHGANIFATNHEGKTALDVAFDANEGQVVDYLLDRCEERIFQESNRLSIHTILREATFFQVKRPGEVLTTFMCLQLGKVVELARGITFLRSLLARYPAAIRSPDGRGDLPLHIACAHPAFKLIRFLVKEYPNALRIRGECGRLPIHVACRNPGTCLSVLKRLVETGGAVTLGVRDQNGFLPLHWQCYCETPALGAVK